MDRVGRTFVFDYGDLALRVRYVSGTKLTWEQLKGPSPGLKGEESYRGAEIRPDVHFIWWREEDGSFMAQVVDFGERRVFSTWSAPGKEAEHFKGSVKG